LSLKACITFLSFSFLSSLLIDHNLCVRVGRTIHNQCHILLPHEHRNPAVAWNWGIENDLEVTASHGNHLSGLTNPPTATDHDLITDFECSSICHCRVCWCLFALHFYVLINVTAQTIFRVSYLCLCDRTTEESTRQIIIIKLFMLTHTINSHLQGTDEIMSVCPSTWQSVPHTYIRVHVTLSVVNILYNFCYAMIDNDHTNILLNILLFSLATSNSIITYHLKVRSQNQKGRGQSFPTRRFAPKSNTRSARVATKFDSSK
jgi:hypothetical protein